MITVLKKPLFFVLFSSLLFGNNVVAQFWKRKIQKPDSVNICNLLISGHVFDSANNEYLGLGSLTIMGCNRHAEISSYYGQFQLLTDLFDKPIWVDSFVYIITTRNQYGEIVRYHLHKNITGLTDRDCKRRVFLQYQRLVVNIPPPVIKTKKKFWRRRKGKFSYTPGY